jgi:hypothetical protein
MGFFLLSKGKVVVLGFFGIWLVISGYLYYFAYQEGIIMFDKDVQLLTEQAPGYFLIIPPGDVYLNKGDVEVEEGLSVQDTRDPSGRSFNAYPYYHNYNTQPVKGTFVVWENGYYQLQMFFKSGLDVKVVHTIIIHYPNNFKIMFFAFTIGGLAGISLFYIGRKKLRKLKE